MGEQVANVTFLGHGQPLGGESQHVAFHHGAAGTDETHDLPWGVWQALRGHAWSVDRASFETDLALVATPAGGWSTDWWDAAWRAASRTWRH